MTGGKMEFGESGKEEPVPEIQEKTGVSAEDYCKLVMQMRKTTLMLQQISHIPLGELTMLLTIRRLMEESGEVRVARLGEIMKLSRPAVSRMLHVLEKKGYIEMKNGEEDQRYLFVQPVQKGMQCLKEEMEDGYEILKRVRERMGEEEMYHFLRSYSRFHTLLTEEIIQLNKENGIRPI